MNLKHKFAIIASDDSGENSIISNKDNKDDFINSNQIYFYDDVTKQSIYNLNKSLDAVTKNLLSISLAYNLKETPVIELYIDSYGGELSTALNSADRIKNNKIPVHSYVEGVAASAATLLSVVAHKRYMRKNSMMMIHQLSSEIWGNFAAIKDEVGNLELLMNILKKIYLEHTKFTKEELDNLLKHDIYLNAEQCLEKGLIDFII